MGRMHLRPLGAGQRASHSAHRTPLGIREPHTPEHKQSIDVRCFVFCFLLQHLGDSEAGCEKIPGMQSISGVVCWARDIKGSVCSRASVW